MDLFKKKTKIKCSFSFTLQAGNYIVASKPVFVQWKRGSGKDQSGQSKKEFASSAGLVLWDETHQFSCAMEMDPKTKKFEEKHMSFTVVEAVEKDKERTIGKAIVNLGELANHGFDEVKEVIVGKGKEKKGSLSIRWRTQWQTYNGKAVLTAEEMKGRPLTEVTRIEGTDACYSSIAGSGGAKGAGDDDDGSESSAVDEPMESSEAGSEADSASAASSKSWRQSADLTGGKAAEKKEHRRSHSLLGLFDKKDKDEKKDKEERKEKKEKEEKRDASPPVTASPTATAGATLSAKPQALPRFPSTPMLASSPAPAPAAQLPRSKTTVPDDASDKSSASTKEKKERKEKKEKKEKKDKNGTARGISAVDADLTSEVLRLRTALSEAERQLGEERKALTAEKTAREEDHRKARAELDARTAEVAGARGEAGKTMKEAEAALMKAHEAEKAAREEEQKTVRAVQKELEEMRARLHDVEARLASEQQQRAMAEQQMQHLQGQNANLQTQTQSLQAQVTQSQASLAQAQAQLQQAQASPAMEQSKSRSKKGKEKDRDTSSAAPVADVAALTAELETLRQRASNAEAAKASQEKEVAKLKKQVLELKEETAKRDNNTDSERQALEGSKKSLDVERKAASDAKKEADSVRKNAEDERHRLEAERKELDAQRKEAGKRQAEVEDKSKALTEKEAAIAKREKELTEREAAAAEKANTSRGVVKVKDAVEVSTIRRQYEQSEKSLQDAKQERDKLRQELHEAQEALAKAREEAKVIIADIEPEREIDDSRVSALQEDNDRLRRLLADAEKKNNASGSNIAGKDAKSASTSATALASSTVDAMVKRLVWTVRYDITRVGSLSIPSAAVELAHCLLETELPSPIPSQLFAAIVASTARSSADRLGLAFWLSSVCGMAHLLQKEKIVAWDISKQGPPSLSDVPRISNTTQQLFDEPLKNRRDIDPAVRALVCVVYSRVLVGFMATLEPMLLSMFFPSPAPGTSAAASADADVGARRLAQSNVLAALSEQLKALRDVATPASVIQELFVVVFGAADAVLFNALLEGSRSVCSAGRAVALKLAVAALDDWISANGLSAIWDRTRLQHISQASNLLMMDKAILLNEESAGAAFPALSAAHRVRLVELFVADELAPEGVAMSVRNAMQSMKARAVREPGPWLASPLASFTRGAGNSYISSGGSSIRS